MQNELTDEEAIKIRFDKEIDVNYKELDVDLTSDEEDSRNPAQASSEFADTSFGQNVIT